MKTKCLGALLLLCVCLTLPQLSRAQSSAASGVPSALDPCISSNTSKVSVSVNITTATTTQIVAISGTTKVYVCGFILTAGGTTPSVQFEFGTGASCGTGTTVLTGPMAPTSGSVLMYPPPVTAFTAPSGNALCIVTGGTTPTAIGVVTYVQQ